MLMIALVMELYGNYTVRISSTSGGQSMMMTAEERLGLNEMM